MTREEFISIAARLVAALQVPVSILGAEVLGTAYEPWQKLMAEVTGGFGWTTAEQAQAAFEQILKKEET